MQDDKIASLMAPFKSAYDNKANDQLEGMVGKLPCQCCSTGISGSLLGVYGDDFDLKILDKANPSYLVIANDPEKEQVIGSLNALVLNRLITRVNSKGNIPVSIIVGNIAHALLPENRPLDWYGSLQQGGGDPRLSGTAPIGSGLRQGGDAEDYHDLR